MRQLRFGVVICGALVGCKAAEVAGPVEGANPGECEDGADNDVDGYFDCDDNNCWGAPVCKDGTGGNGGGGGGVDTDTNGGADTDDPGFSGQGILDNLKSFSMTYLLTFAFDDLSQTLCKQYLHTDNCNCSAVYTGNGVLVEAANQRNTYEGEWTVAASNCAVLDDSRPQTVDVNFNDGAIWRPMKNTHAYHTFHFKSDKSGIIDWITHADLSATERVAVDPMGSEQYWIKATEPHFLDETNWTIHYAETEVKPIDLLIVVNVSDVNWAFSETETPPVLPVPDLVVPL